ncbi:MAG TPA: NADH-quinone oxidoreductase subunit E, partial [Mycobacterium sp.]|nr:NADH-quinone oxidoreductase subunit E [Mycobacterium sp.]
MSVFLELNPKPDEPHNFSGCESYPAQTRIRLEADAGEIIARYPQSRSALLPLLHLV